MSDYDILKASADAYDRRMHRRPRKQEAYSPRPDRIIQPNITLWYRDKHTGRIEGGKVDDVDGEMFLYRFRGVKRVWLRSDCVGVRLFFTEHEAEAYSK